MINCNWLLKSTLLKLGVIVVVVGGGTLFFLSPSQPSQAAGVPDTAEAREITANLERANQILAIPADALDINQLAEVFIDHPDYLQALDAEKEATLQTQISEILGPDAAQNFGYLTGIKSKIVHRQHGIQLLKSAMTKAKAENRELTENDMQELAKQNRGEIPSLPNYEWAGNKPVMIVKSMTIDGDKAQVIYDSGVVDRTALMVRINGRWYVAGLL